MLSTFLKSKLHHVTVTSAELEYQGSLSLDQDFMELVGLRQYEKILVANVENGERFETYAIQGARGSKVCCLNGATAHLGKVGDRIIIFSFCQLTDEEIEQHHPQVAIFGEGNAVIRKSQI